MKKLGIAALAAASLAGAAAQTANAGEVPTVYTGPCAEQRHLFETYNIQIDMYAPLVSHTYGTVCSITG